MAAATAFGAETSLARISCYAVIVLQRNGDDDWKLLRGEVPEMQNAHPFQKPDIGRQI
jgi:hypothetical protein